MITLVTPHETKLMDKLRMCSEALRDSTEQCRVYRAEIDQWEVDYNEMKIERDALALDAARFAFLCDCNNDQALDLLSERLGDRIELIKLTDELISEMKGKS